MFDVHTLNSVGPPHKRQNVKILSEKNKSVYTISSNASGDTNEKFGTETSNSSFTVRRIRFVVCTWNVFARCHRAIFRNMRLLSTRSFHRGFFFALLFRVMYIKQPIDGLWTVSVPFEKQKKDKNPHPKRQVFINVIYIIL